MVTQISGKRGAGGLWPPSQGKAKGIHLTGIYSAMYSAKQDEDTKMVISLQLVWNGLHPALLQWKLKRTDLSLQAV